MSFFEDYLVEENLLNVELKRLKNILYNSNEINSNLEQQQIEIQKVFIEHFSDTDENYSYMLCRNFSMEIKRLSQKATTCPIVNFEYRVVYV